MKKSKLRISLLMVMLVAATIFSGCNKKESSKKEYSKGTVSEDSYESKFLNLSFKAPEGYSMLTEDVLDQYVQFSTDIVYKDTDQKVIDYAKAVTVYEMMCVEDTVNSPNINIVIENLLGKKITEDEYIEKAKEQLQNTGIEYTFGDTTKDVELAGEKYTVLDCVGNYSGQEVLQKMYIRKIDDRMMLLTITYTADTEAGKDTLLAGFSELK
ncbi:DcrB-related protein [Anaerosporobacter sp.]